MVKAAEQSPDGGRRSLEPRRSDSRRNRDRLLESALLMLSADPNATIEEVAAEAGVTRSTVYRRFSGREELLRAVRAKVIEETRALFLDVVAREPEFERCMDVLFRAAVHLSFERRRIWQVLNDIGALADYEPQDAFFEWLAAGQRTGALRDDVPVEWLATVWIQLVGAGVMATDRYGIDLDAAAGMAAEAAARAMRRR